MQFDCIVWPDSVFSQLLTPCDDVEGPTSAVPAATGNTSSSMTPPNIKTAFTCGRVENSPKDQTPGNDQDKAVENPVFD